MKKPWYILILFVAWGCSLQRTNPSSNLQTDEGELAFSKLLELAGSDTANVSGTNAVKIYRYRVSGKGKIKDSTLIIQRNLDFFSNFSEPIAYDITYDSLGREFERYATRVATGERHLNYRKIYDELSRLDQWVVYNDDGKINSATYYHYDADNNLIRKERFYGHFIYGTPRLENLTTYEFQDGALVKSVERMSQSTTTGFETILTQEFDPMNRIINYRSESFQSDSLVSTWGFRPIYNQEGKLAAKEYYSSNTADTREEYRYDTRGLPTESFSYEIKTKEPKSLLKYFYQKEKLPTTIAKKH
ncbi:hypothetical protein [Rufibacter roseus]|uniref:YD repeat-containing protein n=1 Tax=Rufibacter roseus TaxID=1567108 RepID=A0ABW2DUD0_9BACT|nr:hypothetical protein [Rufibacter roseus]